MGLKVGQTALRFGCNDFGSLMIEENVVSAANTTYRTTIGEMERLIRDAGFTPRAARQDYSIIATASRPLLAARRDHDAVGIGYDSHRFGRAAPLILGGVSDPVRRARSGHSDGDAIAHAVTDADARCRGAR